MNLRVTILTKKDSVSKRIWHLPKKYYPENFIPVLLYMYNREEQFLLLLLPRILLNFWTHKECILRIEH